MFPLFFYHVEIIFVEIFSAILLIAINLAASLGEPSSSLSSESINPSPSLSNPSLEISIESPYIPHSLILELKSGSPFLKSDSS